MKQEIKLTNDNENTIHVDDVDVSKGVYAVTKDGIAYLVDDDTRYEVIYAVGGGKDVTPDYFSLKKK